MWTKIIIGIIIFIAIAAVLGYSFTNKYAKLGTAFITLLDEGKMKEAYAMIHSEVVSEQEFADSLSFTSKVKSISWNSREVENRVATINGKISFEDATEFSVKLVFIKKVDTNAWKIAEYDFSPIEWPI